MSAQMSPVGFTRGATQQDGKERCDGYSAVIALPDVVADQ